MGGQGVLTYFESVRYWYVSSGNGDDDDMGSEHEEEVDYFTGHDRSNKTDDSQQPLYDDFFDAPEPDDTPKKNGSEKRDTVKPELDADVGSEGGGASDGSEGGGASEDGEGDFPDGDSDDDMEDVASKKEPLSTHEKKLLKV